MKVCTVSELQSLYTAAYERFGISPELLIESTGQAVCQIFSKETGIAGHRFLILCGTDEQAGYGYVAARHLYAHGGDIRVGVVGDSAHVKGVVKYHRDILTHFPIPIISVSPGDLLNAEVSSCHVIVDGLGGIGDLSGGQDLLQKIIETINANSKPVLSLDLPAGVDADTGNIVGNAVNATYTLGIGLPKIGNLLFPGYEQCGKLYVSQLAWPPELYDSDSLKVELNAPSPLPLRQVAGHKGTFGDVLFIAGAANYFGAPYFAAASFMKAGGGYSRLAAPQTITPVIASKASEIVFVPQLETASGSIALRNIPTLLELSEKVDMVVLGPGLSLDEETQQVVRTLLPQIPKPLLLDGDGITAVSQEISLLNTRQAETILTPHLGEMSRITKRSISDIKADSISILQQAASALQAIIVVKGAHSLIGYPNERVFINMSGNSGMGTAGSGDVLTGTIAAMFGLGLPVAEAVRKGVFIHGLAGDLAASDKGEDGITAQDILDYLPVAVKTDRARLPEELFKRYAGACIV